MTRYLHGQATLGEWEGGAKGTRNISLQMTLNGSQAAQTHYMNADVTLACERCCVTNGYLQRLVWDRLVFLKRDKKMLCF